MAEISQIKLPNGTTYDIKDANARDRISALEAFTTYLGVTTTALTDGATTNPITINSQSVTAEKGNIVLYGNKEFIFDGTHWNEFGDLSALGDLAYKNTASASYKPAGTVSQPSFTGDTLNSTGKFTPSGTVGITTGSGTANYTPAGSVSQPTFTGSATTSTGKFTPAGSVTFTNGNKTATVSKATGTATYTPEGTCSGTAVSLNTTTVNSITNVGTLPSATMPSYSVASEVLTITAGSFSAGTLPTKGADTTVATGVNTVTQPTFTGTGARLVTGNISVPTSASFSGTEGNVSVSGTPSGSVSQPSFTGTGVELKGTFTGTQGNVSVSGTPSGTVSQPTFSGTTATITVS